MDSKNFHRKYPYIFNSEIITEEKGIENRRFTINTADLNLNVQTQDARILSSLSFHPNFP